jgi:D-alanyl-D-alanine carboxypeptidase/D-alanyl-D-alanine-endopeptidase (penicillin-binding protein 4)
MQNAKGTLGRRPFAFCILHFALLAVACSKAPPALPVAPSLDATQQLRADLLATTRAPGVARAAWGIVVQSLDRNERLFELNPRTLLVPASTAKLVSAATAVDAVGWDYRFETTLRTNGAIADGTLSGDLFIVGSGDPAIGGPGGDDVEAWIDALKAQGIRRIDGRVIGDDDAVEEPRPALAWTWDDLGYPTGALFGALNFAENRMAVIVTPAAAPGVPPLLGADAQAAWRPFDNRAMTGPPGSPQLLWPEQRPGEPLLTIAGSIPAGARPAVLAISAGNPTLWFAQVFRYRLQKAGVEVTGPAMDIDDVAPHPATGAMPVLYTYRSHPLADIVRPLFKRSINLYGEALMRLNAAPGALPTNDAALAGLRQRLASWGVPPDGQQLVDGSGLSRRDVVAPETLLRVLQKMYDATGASPWMTALPIAGVDGSLENRMRGTAAERNVLAKTGTMSNIRSLAGYVTTRDGEHLAFVVMVNNFEGTGAAAVGAIDAIAVRLANLTAAVPPQQSRSPAR